MPPVPKRKHSTRRQGKRRASIKLRLSRLVACPHCGEPKKPHQACPKCGAYKKNK